MSSSEEQLISRIIRVGLPAYQQVREWGITLEDFRSKVPVGIFKTFEEYYTSIETKGSIPGPTTISSMFSTFQLVDDASMTTDALCREVRQERLKKQFKELLQESAQDADLNPVAALASIQAKLAPLADLGVSKKTDVDFSKEFAHIIEDYNSAARGDYRSAASWPWPIMQNVTGGLSEDDFIVFYGRPKSMKTWVLCYLIASLFESGKRILLYTKEMTPRNIFKRIASCLARIPYQEFRTGRLDPHYEHNLKDIFNFLQHSHTSQLIALSAKDVASGGDTVGWLRAKAEKYKPEIIVIDGMYLMSDGKGGKSADWSRVTQISREVSAMRLDLGVPVIATMQANRKAASHANAELDELAYADAVGQDATLAIRVINEKSKPTIALVVGGSREFYLHGLRIGGIPSTDFEEKEIMTEKDILKAKEDDAKKEEEPENPDLHAKPRAIRQPRTNGSSTNAAAQQALLNQALKTVV